MFKKEKVNLSSPWITFQHEIVELFKKDPEVKAVIDEDENAVHLFVENPVKADALMELLPTAKWFGNVCVKINVIPANDCNVNKGVLFEQAFEGNPIFDSVLVVEGMYNNPVTYVIFEDKVAQYWNDNLGDPHGNVSTLYQEIAKDVFDVDGVNYCTKPIEE